MQTITTGGLVNQTDSETVICNNPVDSSLTLQLMYGSTLEPGTKLSIRKLGGPVTIQFRVNDKLFSKFQGCAIKAAHTDKAVLNLFAHGDGWDVAEMPMGAFAFPAILFSDNSWDDSVAWIDDYFWED